MTTLNRFAQLQARVYEFLGKLDEPTLLAIVDGTAQLAVQTSNSAGHGRSRSPRSHQSEASASGQPPSSSDPDEVARKLQGLTSEQDRRAYLDSTPLNLVTLKATAKALGLRGHSNFTKAALISLLASHDRHDMAAPQREPAQAVADVDAASIAAQLREIDTEAEGDAYLRAQGLDHTGLVAVATELKLSRVNRLSKAELVRRILKQAISARRKFAGLRDW